MFKTLATTVAFSLAALGAQAATVVNGGFEDPGNPVAVATDGQLFTALASGTGNNSWSIFTALPGWTKASGDGIEIQTNNTLTTINANTGQHYVELDSNNNSSMQQTIDFTSTGRYLLSFFYSPRDTNVASNIISYSVAEAFSPFSQLLLDSVAGPSLDPATSVGKWTEITAEFIVKTKGLHTLTFAALGTKGDKVSFGGFIDDVSISTVPVPLPAGGLLLIGAVGGLAVLRRRKARAA